jgi:hypothetical protein
MYRLDEGVLGSGMGLFLTVGNGKDSAAKFKRSQLDVCTVYAYCHYCATVYSSRPPLAAEICASLAGSSSQ